MARRARRAESDKQERARSMSGQKSVRRIRFSLRALLLAIAACTIPMIWAANYGRSQVQLIARIHATGGEVALVKRPTILRYAIGRGWISRYRVDKVIGVGFSGETPSTELLAEVVSLPTLQHLYLHGRDISSSDFRLVASAIDLNVLDLGSTSADDSTVSQLRSLELLERLGLSDTKVGNRGVIDLPAFRKLEYLDLSKTLVDNDGLVPLLQMSCLKELNLSDTKVDNQGLKVLSRSPNIECLHLGNTLITDECVSDLATMKSLKRLILRDTLMTPGGIQDLADRRPGLLID